MAYGAYKAAKGDVDLCLTKHQELVFGRVVAASENKIRQENARVIK